MPTPNNELSAVSLMWPVGRPPEGQSEAPWAQDLGLEEVAHAFRVDGRYVSFIRRTLSALNTDPAVITWRQAVLRDFLDSPTLADGLGKLLPRIASLRQHTIMLGNKKRSILIETADRLAELEIYVEVVEALHGLFNTTTVQSEALRALREALRRLMADKNFQTLRAELPEMRRPLQRFASLTVGINLDAQLQPTGAVLMSINERPFGEAKSLIGRLFGGQPDGDLESGIAPLHLTPADPEHRPMSALFQDLDRLITQTAQPIARSLQRYVRINSAPLATLENELAFFAAAATLIRTLKARGYTLCQPEVAPVEERISQIDGLLNPQLLLRENAPTTIVPNPLGFDDEGRIAILTGPNSGGKTTYLRAVGLAQVLFQAGLYIPATSARLSPVDAIFTHFPALESGQGRLSEEAARLRHICLTATRHSLVLMNESLSSTTAAEASYLAQDVVCGLRAIGVRALYATHLTELAERIPEFEALVPGDSVVFSLIAGVRFEGSEAALPTYEIRRGAPQGRGYAREIARRHGISLEQILDARRNRPI